MKKLLLLSIIYCLFTPLVNAQEQPKLVVGIVVDQMRYDYIYRFWNFIAPSTDIYSLDPT